MNKQALALKLQKFYFKYKRFPSYKEMVSLFGYASKGSVVYAIQKLIEDGYIGKDENGNLFPKKILSIPNLGIIKAGHPAPADMLENAIDVYDYLLNRQGTIFSLTVKGDSMIDEGIHEGDIVIIEKEREPRNGDIVAAMVDGEWTVKYYNNSYGEITLLPANKRYPVIKPRESLTIGGVVVSTIRKYH